MSGEWERVGSVPDSGWERVGPARLNPNLAAQGRGYETAREDMRSGADLLSGRDEGIDYKTGIPKPLFRAGFSRMTNDAEKANYLDRSVGSGNWGKDSHGAYYIKPEGLKAFGMRSDRPVSIDEQTATRYDVADVAGDTPAILGGIGGGVAASGAGLLPGMGMAALGAAGGKAIDELVKMAQGLQIKSPGEVATTLAGEGASAAVGEGLGRGVMAVGRRALAPGAHRMTPEKLAAAESAKAQGFAIRPGSVTDAPLLARWEGMVRNIFGDLNEQQNKVAAEAAISRLRGQDIGKEAAGESLQSAIKKARVQFSKDAGRMYDEVDSLVGNNPIVPTSAIKNAASNLIEAMPKTADGKIVGGKDKMLRDILAMGDNMTVAQAQRLRTMLREASESPDIIPDVGMHEARILKKAVDDSFDLAKSGTSPSVLGTRGVDERTASLAIQKLRRADLAYKQGIEKFDKPAIKAITKDASKGTVDPDMVVDYLIKPERVVRLRQVKSIVPQDEWAKVKSAHANDLLRNVVKQSDDPLKTFFDGKAFKKELDRYGRDVLTEVHGREWVDSSYAFANALMLADKQMGVSGGIVAANVALHPVQNIPFLTWLRGLARVMQSETAFKYLTTGIRAGAGTKQGAAAITRVFSQAAANARDETGSASVTVEE